MTERDLFELIEPALPDGARWGKLEAFCQHERERAGEMDSMAAASALLANIMSSDKPAGYYETWVPPQHCLPVFRKLYILAPSTGYVPVILGFAGESGYCPPEEATKVLEAAAQIDGRQWLLDQRDPQKRIERKEARIEELRGLLEENPSLQTMLEIEERMLAYEKEALASGSAPEEPQMKWPEREHPRFSKLQLQTGKAQGSEASGDEVEKGVCIAVVPARHSWELPAFLDFGGWNSCPDPEVHCAVLKYFSERFGAELVMMETDTLQLAVGRPPKTREDAWQLAIDQNTYAEFDQLGALADPSTLASALLESPHWFFWWD